MPINSGNRKQPCRGGISTAMGAAHRKYREIGVVGEKTNNGEK